MYGHCTAVELIWSIGERERERERERGGMKEENKLQWNLR